MAAAAASQVTALQQKLDDANKQIKKLKSMQTFGIFGEEFRKWMQQDADDYMKKAIAALNKEEKDLENEEKTLKNLNEEEKDLENEEKTLKNKETLTKVRTARGLLLEADPLHPPSSKNAAKALMQIGAHDVENKDHINNPKLNELRARVRDAVAMSVRAEAEKPKDENSYQQVLDGAFGDRLDRKLRAVIMLAYHKLMSSDGVDKPDKFKSRAQQCNGRRSVPRKKRDRRNQSSGGGDARPAPNKAPAPENGGVSSTPEASSSDEAPVPEPKAPSRAGRSPSGGTVAAPAWQAEPLFVPMPT